MGNEAFIERVERLGAFDRREDAEQAIGAVLAALGERLVDADAHALARALPGRAGVLLRQRAFDRAFGLDEMVARVATQERVGRASALEHLRAVLKAVGESIPVDARARLHKALAHDIAALLDA
jgi:uncharacterized protein (DUF2267 family)